MTFSFDNIIDRSKTNSLKYDFASERGKPEGIIPMWVADMDFPAPQAVIDALVQKSKHGIFGYSETAEDYFEILHNWFLTRFQWEIKAEWLVKTPGVVYAINTAIRSLTNPADAVLIQEPVYYPFSQSVKQNDRKLVINQLIYKNGSYTIDLADFEEKIKQHNVKLFILCSPHNPVGRVWTKEELIAVGDICQKYGVLVVADEIHADFVYPGSKHLVFSNLKPEYADITVTCTAPSKTFNLAGLQISNIFIANKTLRNRFRLEMARSGYSQVNIMGIVACKAAYAHGTDWLLALITYLHGNLLYAEDFLKTNLPEVRLVKPEGTYVLWLDFSRLGLTDDKLDDLIVHKAGLWLSPGPTFGTGGSSFQRMNIACPRSVLKKALQQLEQAVKAL